MYRVVIALTVLLLMPALGSAQSPLVGVWELTRFENVAGAEDGAPTESAYSAWFANGYYVIMWETSDGPRPTYGDDPSDAELVAAWTPLAAQFGTYEIDGSTYTATQLVAKNPSGQGNSYTREFSVEGNTLVTRATGGGATYTYRRVR